ncbi:hypothetical protein SAMN05216224_101793 [Thioclava dalianensis]|nr:hypothetical protein SAMN05216224_101793 [Thioclava dalianensis]
MFAGCALESVNDKGRTIGAARIGVFRCQAISRRFRPR